MSDDYTVIRIDRKGHIAEVVLDSPERLNAMAPAFFEEIGRAFDEIDKDPEIRVAILWAEGRLFTAGLDLKAAGSGILGGGSSDLSPGLKNDKMYRGVREWQDCFTAIEKCRKPVIAAVHGHCIGGGVDLTTACDIRICTRDATFSIKETQIAIVADVGTLQRITPLVGKGFAREMAYTGKRVSAERAERAGLVNDVYETKDEMLEAARKLAGEIAANSPLVVQGVKQVLQYSEEHTTHEGLEFVAHWNAARIQTNDLTEAIAAFLEKREPHYKGN